MKTVKLGKEWMVQCQLCAKAGKWSFTANTGDMVLHIQRIHGELQGLTQQAGKGKAGKGKRIANKLQNSRVNHITFHTLRHWKATMEYHRTKDILHVKQILGHKSINSTLMYTQLINFKEDDFHVKVAKNIDDACELVKAGFQYVTGEYDDGGKIFRKRK